MLNYGKLKQFWPDSRLLFTGLILLLYMPSAVGSTAQILDNAWACLQRGRSDSARILLDALPEMALNDSVLHGKYAVCRGVLEYYDGEMTLAFTHLQEAEIHLKPYPVDNWLLLALEYKGHIYRWQSEYDIASTIYLRVLHLIDSLQDLERSSRIYNLLGILARQSGDYERSIALHEKALMGYSALEDSSERTIQYNNMAMTYEEMGDYFNALRFFRRSLRIKLRANNPRALCIGYINLAECYMHMDSLSMAMELGSKAIHLADSIQNQRFMAVSKVNMSNYLQLAGELEPSKRLLDEILGNIDLNQDEQVLIEVYRLLYQYNEQHGDAVEALKLHQQYLRLKDSVEARTEKARAVRRVQQYELAQKQLVDSLRFEEEKNLRDLTIS